MVLDCEQLMVPMNNSNTSPDNTPMNDSNQSHPLAQDAIVNAIKKAKANQKPSTSKLGVSPGWRKATFIVREEHFQKMKDLAHWERIPVKDLLDQLLERFLANRKIEPTPKEKRDLVP